MSEIIERVAVAIERESRMRVGTADSNVNAVFEGAKLAARAAIMAMREPNQKMLDAGPHEPYMDRDVWASMIDAALKD